MRGHRFLSSSLNPCLPQAGIRGNSRKNIFFQRPLYILFYLAFILNLAVECLSQEWQELSSEHFIVYFTQDEKFAKEVLEKAEFYYRRIATNLGYPRYSAFWLWDKRVKIYIYPDHASFINKTHQPQWSGGMADYKNKQIISYAWSKGFLESLLPHEMAHLIFRDFVGFKSEIPLWLDEGVAQQEEEAKREEMKATAKKLFNEDALLSIEDMMKLDIKNIKEDNRLHIRPARTKDRNQGVLFISAKQLIDTYYIQAASLVGFLIEKYGSNAFAHFCRQLRDGNRLEEALKSAYPTYIHNLKEFEDRWREYLEK